VHPERKSSLPRLATPGAGGATPIYPRVFWLPPIARDVVSALSAACPPAAGLCPSLPPRCVGRGVVSRRDGPRPLHCMSDHVSISVEGMHDGRVRVTAPSVTGGRSPSPWPPEMVSVARVAGGGNDPGDALVGENSRLSVTDHPRGVPAFALLVGCTTVSFCAFVGLLRSRMVLCTT